MVSSSDAPFQDVTVTGMLAMFRRCGRFISWRLVAEVLERWDFFVVDDQPCWLCTGSGGLLSSLVVVGFVDVVWDSYFSSIAIAQHPASWKVLDLFLCAVTSLYSYERNWYKFLPCFTKRCVRLFWYSGLQTSRWQILLSHNLSRFCQLLVCLSRQRCHDKFYQLRCCGIRVTFFLLFGFVLMVTFFVILLVAGNDIFHVYIFLCFLRGPLNRLKYLEKFFSVCGLVARTAPDRDTFSTNRSVFYMKIVASSVLMTL